MSKDFVTRFAPSPTGGLHIGGVRTALYCYALVKKHGGNFILRIEDTDRKRFVEGATEEIIELLELYGLPANTVPKGEQLEKINDDIKVNNDWVLNSEDTLAVNDDDFKNILIQTQRLPLYQKYALQLIDNGYAYYCFRTAEDLAALRKTAEKDGSHKIELGREYTNEEAIEKIKAGEKFVIRLDVEAYGKKKQTDVIKHACVVMGDLEFPIEEVTDQVLMKSDGIPTYHLAVVVDDYTMKITHPMRAAEWIPSTPKQVMIYEALGWEMPPFVHVTAILDPSGGKLSKRKGSVSAAEFIKEGYLPEAVLNFLMLLGWSSPEKREHGEEEREFFTLEDFVDLFDLKDLNKANPVFNREKLLWFNQKYITQLTPDNLVLKFSNWLKKYGTDKALEEAIIQKGPDFLEEVLMLTRERSKILSELSELIMPFYLPNDSVDYKSIKQTKKIDKKVIGKLISGFREELKNYKNLEEWGHEDWEEFVRHLADGLNVKPGQAFMVLRLAILRSKFSPPLFESMDVLGKEEVLTRLEEMI